MFAPLFQGLSMKISVKNTCKYLFAALFLSTAFSINVFANEEHHEGAGAETQTTEAAGEHHEEKFNAGKMIMEHILDSHEWHHWGSHSNPVSFYLPIILYTNEGVEFFPSSKHLVHGETVTGKYYTYKMEKNVIKAVTPTGEAVAGAKVYDLSITKNVLAMFISIILTLLIFIPVARKYQANPNSAPSGLQSFLEPIIIFIKDNVAIPNIGEKNYQKYMPFLLTVFFFLLFNNLLGLIPVFPGGANLTGNISVAFTLAGIVLITVLVTANKNYWIHIFAMPGVPKPILIILTPIEILGFVLRPFVLMMRLFANMLAGHIVILSFIALIFIFGEMSKLAGYGVSIFSMLMVVFMSMLELLVAFLQAYVFTLLSAIYFGSAIEDHGHHEHDAF